MAKQTINLGTAPTGAGGDTFRAGSAKLQANDDEIYAQLGATAQGVLPAALPINKGGTGAATAAAARTALGLTLTTSNTDSTPGRVLKVGDFGLGSTSAAPSILDYGMDASGVNKIGFGCYTYTAGNTGTPTEGTTAGGILVLPRDAGQFAAIAFESSSVTASAPKMFIKHTRYNNGAWYQVKHAGNTTVDANGFIKNASPIVKLFADRIELNDEAQQQNIEFEKLGVGDYLIKGSTGFAQEGWYVETPKDANGNVLFSVIYTPLENGDISVKTYKKKFDFETVSIVADLENPVDITENRWIDLRLQELPQPEIEEPESIAPPEFQPTGLAEAVATVMESYNDPEQ